ncbi:MAG: hypothetical protein QXL17_02745 [Candidatus Thermoplasmatota archaeon]
MSKSKSVESLTWNQRLAIIDKFNPTDEQVCAAFGVSSAELKTAQEMRQAGTLTPSKDIDLAKYSNIFEKNGTNVSHHTRPETANKRTQVAKKRGRKGDKIQQAFTAIPSSPVHAEQFVKQHNISMAVLRQSKRFDKTGLGVVRVKKDKATKSLMVWRETN